MKSKRKNLFFTSMLLIATLILSNFMCITGYAISGAGTTDNPYIITTEEEFDLMCDVPSAHYKLGTNLTLTSNTAIDSFTGSFDGDGYYIYGMTEALASTNRGVIKNVTVVNSGSKDAEPYSASLVNKNYGTIENCHVEDGTLTATSWINKYIASIDGSGYNALYFSTFVYANYGTIKNCYSTQNISLSGLPYVNYGSTDNNDMYQVGGFVGYNEGTIENCYYDGTEKSSYESGGIWNVVSPFVGTNKKSTSNYLNDGGIITNCFYNNDTMGKKNDSASGKSKLALQMQGTYTNWDFSNVWAISSSVNNGLPYLRSERRYGGAPAPSNIAVTAVYLNENHVPLYVGDQWTLTATIEPSTATNKNVAWSSSNTTVASVSNGVITAKAAGSTVITVTTEDGNKTAICDVTVTKKSTNTCGDNLTWSIANGTLTISGLGEMYDYGLIWDDDVGIISSAPWSSRNSEIHTVLINEGVTTVGENAFYGMYTNEISLPDSLEKFKYMSFAYTNIETFTFSKNLSSFNTAAFYGCVLLTDIYVDSGCTWLKSVNGVLMDADRGFLYVYPAGKKAVEYTVPSDITEIHAGAFYIPVYLEKIYIHDNVTTIEDGAFSYCDDLTIYASENSTAHQYATANEINFVATDSSPDVIAVTGVSLNKSSLTLEAGKTATLTANVIPSNATNKAVTWKSSNTTVASVSNGVITAKAVGSAVITVTTEDGNKTASCTVTVIANVIDEDAPKITINEIKTQAGKDVTLNVDLENNTGFSSLGVEVGYNSDYITLTNVTSNPSVGATFSQAQYYTANPFNLGWKSASNITYNGNLATMTFSVKENTPDGIYPITLDYYKGRDNNYVDGVNVNYDENFNSVGFVYVSGGIIVASYIPGDINGDEMVDDRDITYLLRYLAGWDIAGIVDSALDIDGSSMVDDRDITILMRYLAGWDVELH